MYKLNCVPTPADHPLKKLARLVRGSPHPLPPESSWLSGWALGVVDQFQVGSCTGNASACWRDVLHGSATKQKLGFRLSRDYPWAKTRQAEGTFPADTGCSVGDVMAVWQTWGGCRESLLPYEADPTEAPTPECDEDAKAFRIGPPLQVEKTPQGIKTVIAAGMPILIGMPVGASFQNTGSDGKVPFSTRKRDARGRSLPLPGRVQRMGDDGLQQLGRHLGTGWCILSALGLRGADLGRLHGSARGLGDVLPVSA